MERVVAKIIPFPLVTESDKLRELLVAQENEIKIVLQELEDLNDLVVDLTIEYEELLNKLCKINGINLEERYNNDN